MQYLCFHTTSLAWRPFLILLFLFLFLLSQQYLAFFHQKMCMEFLICAVSTVVTVSAVSRKARLTLTTLTNLHCCQPEKIPHPALTCGPAHATCFHSITVQHMRPLVQDPLCSVAWDKMSISTDHTSLRTFIHKFYLSFPNSKNVTILPKQNIDHHFYLHLLQHNHLCFKTHRRNNIFTSKIQTVILQTPLPIFITAVSIQIKNLSNHSLHKTQPCTHLCFRTLWWGFWAGIRWVPVLWIGWRCPVCWWRWCCRGSSAWWKLPAALPKEHNDCIRNFWNRCDICKVVKVVHGHWWDNHCNHSDTWSSMLLELY